MDKHMIWLWPALLALAAFFGSWALACVLPFAAVATLAAATMPARQAAIAVMGAWAINQLVGYTLLTYPHSIDSYGWGFAIGGAATAGLVVARAIIGARVTLARVGFAFLGAFAGYEVLLFVLAQFVGGLETFTPAIVGALFLNEVVWLAGLGALWLLLGRAAPRLFAPTLRTA